MSNEDGPEGREPPLHRKTAANSSGAGVMTREARLAAALRDNLRRRKAAARIRKESGPARPAERDGDDG